MGSKEKDVLKLFFDSGRYWHFNDILEKVDISRMQLSSWLKKFEKEGLILRVKEKGRHPYYKYNFEDPRFRNRKRLFAIEMFTESGLLDHLAALEDAKVVILFGSFSRADWYDGSDIDIFIYGSDASFEQGRFERRLKREIQVFSVKDKKGLRSMDKMLPAIVCGDFIKGNMHDLEVELHAKA